jgi:hypothetical protein
MRRLTRPLLILIALVFLFEVWLWDHLKPIVAGLVGWIPWRRLKAGLKSAIRTLPPAATLLVFLVPIILLLPLKFLGLWLLAQGSWLGATATLVFAKIASMGVTAFIFEVTRPKLLRLRWFRWLYEHVMAWIAWAHALVDPIKQRAKALARMFGPRRASRTIRLLWRIRRRMRSQAAV